MFLADFHMHSNFSDGKWSIPDLVDAYGSRGFGAIAITDHLTDSQNLLGRASAYLGCSLTRATFPLYQAILKSERERAWDQYGMLVIPGFELTHNSISNHRSAHILALGVTEMIFPTGEVTEWIDQIHDKGGIAIAAHPVWTRYVEKQTFHLWDRREELRDKIDAWEVASGPYLFEEVQKSKLPVIANSDLHRPRQITSWKTTFHCERTQDSVFEAILQQKLGIHFYEEVAHVPRLAVPWDMGFGSWGNPLGNVVCS